MYPAPTYYTYPDGTKASRQPADGEIFHIHKNGSVDSTWQYDDFLNQWFNVTSSKQYSAANTATHPPGSMMQGLKAMMDKLDEADKKMLDEGGGVIWGGYVKKCDCGTHACDPKTPPSKHSTWCKIYDPNT